MISNQLIPLTHNWWTAAGVAGWIALRRTPPGCQQRSGRRYECKNDWTMNRTAKFQRQHRTAWRHQRQWSLRLSEEYASRCRCCWLEWFWKPFGWIVSRFPAARRSWGQRSLEGFRRLLGLQAPLEVSWRQRAARKLNLCLNPNQKLSSSTAPDRPVAVLVSGNLHRTSPGLHERFGGRSRWTVFPTRFDRTRCWLSPCTSLSRTLLLMWKLKLVLVVWSKLLTLRADVARN